MNERSVRYFIKSQFIVMVGYAITQLGSFIAKLLGFSSIQYSEIIIILIASISFTFIITAVVFLKKDISNLFLHSVVNIQFVFWLFLYMIWVFFLHEARILALFFAFMPLIFLATSSNFIQSAIISIAVIIIQLGASYYGIHMAHQRGSFRDVVFYTSWFLPSALYIAYVADLFYKKRKQLRQAKNEAEAARDALWGEMALAKKIQTILLPKKPDLSGFEIECYMNPADEVGGDYYDVITVNGFKWIIIGDVSGHGVPAGLIMMMVQTAIHNTLENNPSVSPSELLVKINKTISNNLKLMDETKYMTITVFAVLENNHIVYAGLHQDIFIYRDDSNSVEIIKTEGMWIGLIDDITSMVKDQGLNLKKNDCMLLYTDGVTESWKSVSPEKPERNNNFFGKDRLIEILRLKGKSKPLALRDAILDELENYESDDDITFMIIKRIS